MTTILTGSSDIFPNTSFGDLVPLLADIETICIDSMLEIPLKVQNMGLGFPFKNTKPPKALTTFVTEDIDYIKMCNRT